ncbi:hypothetical protein JTB14_025592 [Gonioctena quinquepunctata]|nr:hypothetical protein JTB14_025592 [Gonioctena quinquepunctata]
MFVETRSKWTKLYFFRNASTMFSTLASVTAILFQSKKFYTLNGVFQTFITPNYPATKSSKPQRKLRICLQFFLTNRIKPRDLQRLIVRPIREREFRSDFPSKKFLVNDIIQLNLILAEHVDQPRSSLVSNPTVTSTE